MVDEVAARTRTGRANQHLMDMNLIQQQGHAPLRSSITRLPAASNPLGWASLLLLVAGCAVQPPNAIAPTAPGAAQSAPQTPDRDLYVPQADVVIGTPPAMAPPDVTDDPVYQLLMAEFAGLRGHLDVAVENYLKLARQTRTASLAERATKVAIYARNNDAALEAARIWVEAAPNSLEAHQIIAAMFVRHGDAESALKHLEFVLNADKSKSGEKLKMIAALLTREEDQNTALTVIEKLVGTHTDDPDALVAYALLAIRADQAEKARIAMDKLVTKVDINPNIAMAYLAVLQKRGMLPTAIGWMEKAVARTPEEFGLRLLYARLLADSGHYEQARMQFEILAQKAPDNTDVIYALGLLNLQANRVDQAEKNLQALLKYEERADDAHYYLGQIEETRQQYAAALAHYRAIKPGTNYFPAQLRIALLLSLQNKVDEARAQLVAVQPENDAQKTQLLRAEAEILVEHERYPEAMALYDQALIKGYDTDLLYTRAMLAEKMGKIDVLERDLKAIIEREPNNAQALNALGYTLADRTSRFEEAHGYIKRALEVTPEDFYTLDSMGWVLYRLGRLEEAIPYLERARKQRNDPEVAAHLGEVLWQLGRKDQAREVWNGALQLKPDDPRIKGVIERLGP